MEICVVSFIANCSALHSVVVCRILSGARLVGISETGIDIFTGMAQWIVHYYCGSIDFGLDRDFSADTLLYGQYCL